MSIKITMVCWSSRSLRCRLAARPDFSVSLTELRCLWRGVWVTGEWHFIWENRMITGKSRMTMDDLGHWIIPNVMISLFEEAPFMKQARSWHARWRRSTGPSLRPWHSLFWSGGFWFKVGRGSAAAADDDDDYYFITNIIMIMIISPSSLTH